MSSGPVSTLWVYGQLKLSLSPWPSQGPSAGIKVFPTAVQRPSLRMVETRSGAEHASPGLLCPIHGQCRAGPDRLWGQDDLNHV